MDGLGRGYAAPSRLGGRDVIALLSGTKKPPGWAAFVRREAVLIPPVNISQARRRLKSPTQADGAGDIRRLADASGMHGEGERGLGVQRVVDVEADTYLIAHRLRGGQ